MSGYEEVYLKGCIGIQTKIGTSLCARGMMCPKCESRRASRRGSKLMQKLNAELEIAEESGWDKPDVGVLTLTIPGRGHPVRHAGLLEQYDYVTQRVTLPGNTGWHSMRGVNKMLDMLGVHGGCHNLEFTWNEEEQWWNTHLHSLVIGYGIKKTFDNAGLFETAKWVRSEEGWDNDLIEDKHLTGGFYKRFEQLGLGRRYSLDWAEEHEYESIVRYSAKVAYMTKPVKATKEKRGELVRFFLSSPRLSRPIGDWRRTFYIDVPN
jgi:hypothetical protein